MKQIYNDILFDVLTSNLFENKYFMTPEELDADIEKRKEESDKQSDTIEVIVDELHSIASEVADIKANDDFAAVANEEISDEEEIPLDDYSQQVDNTGGEGEYSLPPSDSFSSEESVDPNSVDPNAPQEVDFLSQEPVQNQQLPINLPSQQEVPEVEPQQVPQAPPVDPAVAQPQYVTVDMLQQILANQQPQQAVQPQPPMAPQPAPAAPVTPMAPTPQIPQQAAPMAPSMGQMPSPMEAPTVDPMAAQMQPQMSMDPNAAAGPEQQIPMDPSMMGMSDPSMMGGEMPQDPMAGISPGGDPYALASGETMMPGMEAEVDPTPSEIGKSYLLEKIHNKLLEIDEMLLNFSHPLFLRFKEDFKEALYIFKLLLDNVDQFKDKLDIIIAQYERFLIVCAKEMLEINEKIKEEQDLEEKRTRETLGLDNEY